MVSENKQGSPKVENLDSKNRKSSGSENSEKLSSARGLVKDIKKLEELKESPENKAAVAVDSGIPVEEVKSEKVKKKQESKPAVAKADKKKNKAKEDVVELEREYVVPMRKGFLNVPHYRRAKKAVKTLKEFMVRHMNVRDGDLRKIKVDINLNNEIWFRGIKNPLHKIKVRAKKIGGVVYVTLSEPADYVKFKMARDAKKRAIAESGKKKDKAGKKVEDKDKDKDGVDDKVEEKEGAKAGSEKAVKDAKVESKGLKHTAQGKHAQKTMPVRKVLK